MESYKPKYLGIQALRGIAACMVVVIHSTRVWCDSNPGYYWINGAAGVDIFFVISGFVMAISSIDKKGLTASQFLRHRITRIYPLYWAMTLLLLIQIWIHANRHGLAMPFAGYVIRSLLLSPTIKFPLLAQGWTLCFEMAFYVLFALGIFLRVDIIKFLTPLLIAFALLGIFRTESWPIIISPLMIEFLFGLILGNAVRKGYRPTLGVSYLIGAAGFASLFMIPLSDPWRALWWGIPAFLIVHAVIGMEAVPKFLLALGDASYSLYLSHILIVSLLAHLTVHKEVYMVAISVLVSICAAYLIYIWLERPLTRWAKGP